MFKGLGNLMQVAQQAGKIQGKMAEVQEKLAKLRVEGSAGGGAVTAEVSGQQKVLAIRIDQALAESGDREMLEEMTAAAVNQALDKAREAAAEEMREAAGGLDIPGLGDALSKMGMGGPAAS